MVRELYVVVNGNVLEKLFSRLVLNLSLHWYQNEPMCHLTNYRKGVVSGIKSYLNVRAFGLTYYAN